MLKLTELYVKEVTEKRIAIEDVPSKLRDSVKKELNKIENSGE